MPYPPNKGDKVRSYHLLRHLASKHQVFLGTFIDDPEDDAHVDTLREWCSDIHIERLHPKLARLASLRGLLGRSALTLCYYQSRGLSRWVQQISEKHQLDAVVVFFVRPFDDFLLLLLLLLRIIRPILYEFSFE